MGWRGEEVPVAVEARGWVGAEVLEGAAGEAGYFFCGADALEAWW